MTRQPGTSIAPQEKSDLRRAFHRFGKNPLSVVGFLIILIAITVAVSAPLIAPYPEDRGARINFKEALQPPSKKHLFGTDEVGRDVLSRVVYGSRISLLVGLIPLSLIVVTGSLLGLSAGYLGGPAEVLIMRVCDVFLSIPPIVLALAFSAVFRPSLSMSMIAIGFGWWPWYARLVYGETLSVKGEDFVEVSKSLGASRLYVMIKEILPNVTSPIIVKASMDLGVVILTGATLGFLGLGAQPPTPEWGVMIAFGRSHLPTRWWVSVFPGLAIFITVLGFNLLGDGLRDFFDVEVT